MSDSFGHAIYEPGTVEVSILCGGRLIGRELCESEEQALTAVRSWLEFDGVECRVTGLSSGPGFADGDGEPLDPDDEAYPEELELDRSADEAIRFGE